MTSSPERQPDQRAARPVPRTALIIMFIIVVALAVVSLFANFQRLRRDKIEEVTIIPAASASPSVSPTPGAP